jgi:hypothetical protein
MTNLQVVATSIGEVHWYKNKHREEGATCGYCDRSSIHISKQEESNLPRERLLSVDFPLIMFQQNGLYNFV